jgi:hypothetical protein
LDGGEHLSLVHIGHGLRLALTHRIVDRTRPFMMVRRQHPRQDQLPLHHSIIDGAIGHKLRPSLIHSGNRRRSEKRDPMTPWPFGRGAGTIVAATTDSASRCQGSNLWPLGQSVAAITLAREGPFSSDGGCKGEEGGEDEECEMHLDGGRVRYGKEDCKREVRETVCM